MFYYLMVNKLTEKLSAHILVVFFLNKHENICNIGVDKHTGLINETFCSIGNGLQIFNIQRNV